LLLAAVILWVAIIVYTISLLVPINNRVAHLQAALLKDAEAHKKWDMLHRLRILLLVVALEFALLYGVLE